jgi:hypothetical protein
MIQKLTLSTGEGADLGEPAMIDGASPSAPYSHEADGKCVSLTDWIFVT